MKQRSHRTEYLVPGLGTLLGGAAAMAFVLLGLIATGPWGEVHAQEPTPVPVNLQMTGPDTARPGAEITYVVHYELTDPSRLSQTGFRIRIPENTIYISTRVTAGPAGHLVAEEPTFVYWESLGNATENEGDVELVVRIADGFIGSITADAYVPGTNTTSSNVVETRVLSVVQPPDTGGGPSAPMSNGLHVVLAAILAAVGAVAVAGSAALRNTMVPGGGHNARSTLAAAGTLAVALAVLVGVAAGQPNSLAQTQDVQTAVLTGTAYQLVDQTIIDGVVVQETEVPVVGGRVVIPELSIDMPLNSDGSFALTDLSVTTDSEDPTNVTVTFSSPGLGDYTYAHVRLYPGTVGPNLTPQLVKAPRINDRSDAYPDSDVAPPPNNLALGSAASGGLCTPSRERLVLPPTIRVWENGPGQDGLVHSIDFKSYVKHVLPSEWIASWPAESLRAGAMAVKSFGWWHATHAYNKPNPLGTCYDVDATVNFQVFDPDYDHPNTNAAVDATWSYYMILDSGLQSDVVHAFYKSGYSSDACGDWFGPGAPGNDMSQWGSKSCADGGMPWYYILPTYYFPPSVSWILRYSGDDSDGDRCPNGSEVGTTEGTGGRRNLHNPWDYMNPTHDGLNRMDDILMVQGQYFKDDNDGNPGLPPYAPGYNPDTDRTGIGPRDWDLGAPNGQQRTDDILNMTKQYFHDCHV